MATPVHSPHPFLKEPVLYVVDPPNRLEWIHLQETFKLCGIISSDGKSAVEGKQGRRKWPIRFQNLFQAEMALATIQGAYAAQLRPPWALVLSHSPTLEKPSPSPRLFPQYLKFEENSFLDGTVTMDQLFRWFRVAGPLASVKMDVYVGNSQRTATVEYFREEHANFARMTTNGLHRKLRNRAKFSLRTYNPYSLRCSARLQGSWRQVSQLELTTIFTQFGHVTSVVTKSIEFKAYGFVTFSSQYCAAQALQQTDGRARGKWLFSVCYEEPADQHIFVQLPTSTNAPSPDVPPKQDEDLAASTKAEQQRQEAIARERKAQEAAKEASEAKAKKLKERQLRRAEVDRTNTKAKKDLEAAKLNEATASWDFALAQQARETAGQELIDAKKACAEAKQIWIEAMDRETKATQREINAEATVDDALRRKQKAGAAIKIAQQEEKLSRMERDKLDRELAQDEADDDSETVRQAELAEKIKRMEELRKIEREEQEERKRREAAKAEAERLEREARERAEAERLAREREEAERLARERQEREEQEKRRAENTKRLYYQGATVERARCYERDLQYCAGWNVTMRNVPRALARFVGVSEEFDSLKFHETAQPLTFESVPWPILDHPHRMSFDRLEGTTVDQFFASVKDIQTHAEYMSLVKKARNRFHPDRWRSRGILVSVLDEDLRGRLEVAGNEVSKQINHLWDKIVQ